MGFTKQLNSKSNIKQFSDGDLPINPRQPVIARYQAESTLGQTVISLPWTVDTVNAQDNFFLAIDGKVLALGSAYDYTMTSVDVLGYSNQVTLNYSLVAGFNIQAWKLGIKKESEMAQDQRFVNLYEGMEQGFQSFVKTSDSLTATATVGTPATGTFYSSISNRSSITDLSKDLKARMGIERLMVQQLYQISSEIGANGESVFAVTNDIFNQMRFVGQWSNINSTSGPLVRSGANTTDYVELTFYGTGVNLITTYDDANRNAVYSIDGGAESSDLFPASLSTVLIGRNYAPNQVLPLAANLTLGIHTVKVRNNTASNDLNIYGFEILNESSLVKTNAGTSYNQGKKLTSASQSSVAYNTGVTGTKGGRMLIYQNSDGTIGRAFQAVDASQLTLTSANHANEEIARVYHWREFGSNRSDDFSTLSTGVVLDKAFTLDDGTTNLVGRNMTSNTNLSIDGSEYLSISGNGNYITFTFVGTGLDIHLPGFSGGGTGDTCSISIDGAATVGNIQCTAGKDTIVKIASGLPYGTHTVNIVRTQSIVFWAMEKFIVYQPKKPTLPSGATELADYNVMADFAANTTAGLNTIATGVLRKVASQREASYVNGAGGSTDWTLNIGTASFVSAINAETNRTGYMEYTFFGTGFELRFATSSNRSANISVSLQSLSTSGSLLSATTANFPSLVSSVYGTGAAFASGTLDQNDAGTTNGAGMRISGLPLGEWKVRFTNNSAGSLIDIQTLDIITPIHAPKSDIPFDMQNTLPVGSLGISDNRKLSPVKSESPNKNISQAFGVTSAPSTTSTVYVPCPEMSVIHLNRSGKLKVSYTINAQHNSTASLARYSIFIDGMQVSQKDFNPPANSPMLISDSQIVNIAPGTHKIDIYWLVTGNTSSLVTTQRVLTVEEV